MKKAIEISALILLLLLDFVLTDRLISAWKTYKHSEQVELHVYELFQKQQQLDSKQRTRLLLNGIEGFFSEQHFCRELDSENFEHYKIMWKIFPEKKMVLILNTPQFVYQDHKICQINAKLGNAANEQIPILHKKDQMLFYEGRYLAGKTLNILLEDEVELAEDLRNTLQDEHFTWHGLILGQEFDSQNKAFLKLVFISVFWLIFWIITILYRHLLKIILNLEII